MATRVRAARESLADEARRPSAGSDFAESVMGTVRSIVGHDGYCLLGLDPCTGLRSFLFSRNGLDGVAGRLAHNEHVEHDLNRYTDLGAADVPVGVMSISGSSSPPSPRLHEILRPQGFSSELRLALRSGGTLWGALVLFRGDRLQPFSPADAAATLAIADSLTAMVRRYPVRPSPRAAPLAPGVVVLGAHNEVVSVSAGALSWLEDARPGGADEVNVSDVMRIVFDVGLELFLVFRAVVAVFGEAEVDEGSMPCISKCHW